MNLPTGDPDWDFAYYMEVYVEPFLGVIVKTLLPAIETLITIFALIVYQLSNLHTFP